MLLALVLKLRGVDLRVSRAELVGAALLGLMLPFLGNGFVAIGDAGVTRLFKNGIGSALRTARRAAWIAVSRGCSRADFVAGYLPLSRAIDLDNQIGRLLFLQVPLLKRFDAVSTGRNRGERDRERVTVDNRLGLHSEERAPERASTRRTPCSRPGWSR